MNGSQSGDDSAHSGDYSIPILPPLQQLTSREQRKTREWIGSEGEPVEFPLI